MKDKDIIFEKSNDSLSYFKFGLVDDKEKLINSIPVNVRRDSSKKIMPDVSENEAVRHYINLSNKNYGVDSNFYPLGSCTMKYNPKINEKISKDDRFNFHPYSDNKRVQGNLKIMYECKKNLLEITGMDDLTLSPCAGAHGEQTGLYIIREYFIKKGKQRSIILIPDSAHGTNPASASVAGFKTVTIKSNAGGFVDLEDLKSKVNDNVAGFMLTNPNTLGLFEKNIEKIVDICKKYDIQLYYDGANLNALLGISKPGLMGFDVVHINLHKTFSTPHGTGGPGAGPVAVKSHLKDFLPGEDIIYDKKNKCYSIKKIGTSNLIKMRSFYANFLVVLKAYIYIISLGREGVLNSGLISLLNANYLGALLKDKFDFATKDHIMHEFVISLTEVCKKTGITVGDFAKRILDYGFHSPTVSFPLIVHDCLMIEPTETESKKTLDKFTEVMIKIIDEAINEPQLLKDSPYNTPVKRVDDVRAARQIILKYED